MPFVFKRLALLMSIAAVAGLDKAAPAEKDRTKFEISPAMSYASHQTSEKVTIGATAYDTAEKARTAFGKLNPYQYGVLPVLVVIQNDGEQALRLDRVRVDYVAPDGNHVEATPAADVRYLSGPRQPKVVTGPLPSHEPVPPARIQPGLPADLQTVCLKCLEKEPARRLGDRGARFFRQDDSAGAIHRRVLLFPDRPPAPCTAVRDRNRGSFLRPGVALLRVSPPERAPLVRFCRPLDGR